MLITKQQLQNSFRNWELTLGPWCFPSLALGFDSFTDPSIRIFCTLKLSVCPYVIWPLSVMSIFCSSKIILQFKCQECRFTILYINFKFFFFHCFRPRSLKYLHLSVKKFMIFSQGHAMCWIFLLFSAYNIQLGN